jgi:oligopeptide transport system substrate-binding protein
MQRRIYFHLLFALIAVLFSFGCMPKDKTSSGKSTKAKQKFRCAIRTNLTTLDPAIVVDLETSNLLRQVYEGLVTWDENNNITPQLAEKWEVLNKGKLYRFFLRKKVLFSSGRELNANDVKWSIERSCSPKINSPTAALFLGDIVGAKEKLSGKAGLVSGVRVIDTSTLEIALTRPVPTFLKKLTHLAASVLDSRLAPFEKTITQVSQMSSTAPYQIASMVPEQVILLKGNKKYYRGAPKTNTIECSVIKDAIAILNKYMAGDLDVTYVQPTEIALIKNHPIFKDQLHYYASPSLEYLVLNAKANKLFADKRVRRAIAMSIDRASIVKDILYDAYVPAYSLIPSSALEYRSHTQVPAYNPYEGRELLRKAGYPDPSLLPEIKLSLVSQSPASFRCAEALAIQLHRNLGLNVSLQPMDLATFYQKRDNRGMGFLLNGWMPPYLDPENYISLLLKSTSPFNYSNYFNPRIDEICLRADITLDPEIRKKLYAQAEDLALWECSVIPLYFFRDLELVSPRVRGLKRSIFGHLSYQTIHFAN